jgi:hypothetical protein
MARDGSSFQAAIVIKADDESSGVAAEYAWIRAHIPGCIPAGQALLDHDGVPYDLLQVRMPDGSVRDVYFDIASFFGKT